MQSYLRTLCLFTQCNSFTVKLNQAILNLVTNNFKEVNAYLKSVMEKDNKFNKDTLMAFLETVLAVAKATAS